MALHLQLAALFASVAVAAGAATLANVFTSHAVLQQNAPVTLWGFAEAGVSVTLVQFNGANYTGVTDADGIWRVVAPPQPASTVPQALTLSAADGTLMVLEDILFGDVYLCSGQSNQGLPVSVLWNVTEVVAAAANYPFLRLFQAPGSANSSVPLPQFPTDGLHSWQTPLLNGTDNATLLGFSAACYIFGATLYDMQSRTGSTTPVGLLLSAHGGTSILTWQSPASVLTCGDLPNDGWNASVLYNSNIYPLTVGPLALRAAVWYQGEEDCGLGPTESYLRAAWYGCALPALINDWRTVLGQPQLPFVIQQLHAWIHDVNTTGTSPGDGGLALFRAMQQQTVDTVPGLALSVAFDGGDPAAVMSPPGSPGYAPSGTVHPHCKYIPGRRIAAAMYALNNATKGTLAAVSQYPTYSNAVATSYTLNGTSSAITVRVYFKPGSTGQGLTVRPYDPNSNSSHCPTERGVNTTYCDWFAVQVNDVSPVGSWYNATVSIGSDQHSLLLTIVAPKPGLAAVATRNGWSDWPVTIIYTIDGQPVLPWKKSIIEP